MAIETTIQTKTIICNSCHIEKPETDFWAKTQSHCQHRTCKECHSRRRKGFYAKNSQTRKIQRQKYYQANKEKCKLAHIKWKENNKEHWLQYNKDIYARDKIKRREDKLQKAYKLTLIEYNELSIIQNGRCAICGKHQSELTYAMSVDHCHKTGKIRGLLCGRCNTALGSFFDNVEILKNAIIYLEKQQ